MLKYFSMFSGIGGFELGISRAANNRGTPGTPALAERWSESNTHLGNGDGWRSNATCVGFSEVDKYAIKVYEKQFKGHTHYGDATTINANELPDFDLLVGGFPCQSFSVAGKRGGFRDTRGTLFFDVARILKHKRPRYLVLENVKGLLSHDGGKTFSTIIGVLTDLGYDIEWQVLNSKNFGVPQNRERVYIVGCLGNRRGRKVFPLRQDDSVYSEASEPKEPRSQAQLSTTIRVGMATKADSTFIETVAGTINHKRFKETNNQALTLDGNYYKGPDNHGQRTVVKQVGEIWGGQSGRIYDTDGLSPTLSTMSTGGRQEPKIITGSPTYGNGQRNVEYSETDESPTIRATHYKNGDNQPRVMADARIRRLTPKECERLQGFPDDWTLLDAEGGVLSDTQRYKMCGNAVTVNVVEAVINKLITTYGIVNL